MKIERHDGQTNFPDRIGQASHHQAQRQSKNPFAKCFVASKKDEHAQNTAEKAQNAQRLHVFDEVKAESQIADLREDQRVRCSFVFSVEFADERREVQKPIGVGQ